MSARKESQNPSIAVHTCSRAVTRNPSAAHDLVMVGRSAWRNTMNRTEMPKATLAGDRSYAEIRKAWQAAKLHPLWESVIAHKLRDGGPAPNHWQWKRIRPLIDDAMKVVIACRGGTSGLDLDRSRCRRRYNNQSCNSTPNPPAWRKGASSPSHHECAAFCDRRKRRLNDRRRQGLPDGGR